MDMVFFSFVHPPVHHQNDIIDKRLIADVTRHKSLAHMCPLATGEIDRLKGYFFFKSFAIVHSIGNRVVQIVPEILSQ